MLRSPTAPNAAHAEKATAYAKRHHLTFLKLSSQAAPEKLRFDLRRKIVKVSEGPSLI
jgi:hypothetical protein